LALKKGSDHLFIPMDQKGSHPLRRQEIENLRRLEQDFTQRGNRNDPDTPRLKLLSSLYIMIHFRHHEDATFRRRVILPNQLRIQNHAKGGPGTAGK
jgi:hypothetical protein